LYAWRVLVETLGSGPRIVLVHGSISGGRDAWGPQLALADRFELAVLTRPGFPPGPPVEHVDFEEHGSLVAGLLEPGDHVVAHSYGAVIALYAAAARADALRSMTVIEPPAFGIARDRDGMDEFIEQLAGLWADAPSDTREFFQGFFRRLAGREIEPPDPLPAGLEQGTRTLMVERPPWEADPPLEKLAGAPFPKLVVSGTDRPAFNAVCDVLEHRLGAERTVFPGAPHAVQLAQGFNDVLVEFLERARR
jgi:pimeloyl-ACP methyl ester carboxylesterase